MVNGRGLGGVAAVTLLLIGAGALADRAAAQDSRVSMSVERMLDATPEDMLRQAPGWVAEINTIVAELESLEASARRGRGDSAGLPCLVSDLDAARQLQGAAKTASEAMTEAIGVGSTPRASFEFRKIYVALEAARALQGSARECLEGGGLQAGKTRRDVASQGAGVGSELEPVPDDVMDFAFDPFDASPF